MAHFILRCTTKSCKYTLRIEATRIGEGTWQLADGRTLYGGGVANDWLSLPCTQSACKGHLLGRKVQGFVTEQVCSAKCVGAVGHICECACGGENHGGRHAA